MPWATAPMVVLRRSAVERSLGCGCWWLVMFLPPCHCRLAAGGQQVLAPVAARRLDGRPRLGLDGPGWPAGGGRAGQGAGRVQVGALVDPDAQPLHQLPTGPG